MIGLFIALTVQKGICASATDVEIYAAPVEITQAISLDYGLTANVGDFKVELYIENNPGFTGSGIGLYYDKDNFVPITVPGNDNVLDAISLITSSVPPDPNANTPDKLSYSVLVNRNKGVFGITTGGTKNCDYNGKFLTVFLRRKANAPDPDAVPSIGTIVTQMINQRNHDLPYEEPAPYVDPTIISSPVTVTRYANLQYRLGDLNGDGYVNMMDANIISNILGTSASINATVAEDRASALTGYTLDGLFHNGYNAYEGVFIFDVIDVNGDGDVSDADRAQISNFVMADILGLEPEDLGCVSGIGELAFYTHIIAVNV